MSGYYTIMSEYIYNIMLSRLHSLSGYDILVQLGVEIMTVYRMKLFFMCHLMPGCDILMSAYVFARQDNKITTLYRTCQDMTI